MFVPVKIRAIRNISSLLVLTLGQQPSDDMASQSISGLYIVFIQLENWEKNNGEFFNNMFILRI